MKIVVGLGNPGKQYEDTRHNVGWMVLDRIADRAGWSGRGKSRDSASVARGRVGDLDLVLVKPLTYMNLSGEAVRKVLAREHAPLGDLLIVFDDFALPLGRLRLRAEGSAGSHNGMRSIVGELETQKIARLRVGIGEPSRTAVDHVLSRFDAAERRTVDLVLDAAADAVEDWARDGVARAANKWNSWTSEPLLLPAVGSPDGGEGTPPEVDPSAPDAKGIVRSKTGWRKLLDRGPGEERR